MTTFRVHIILPCLMFGLISCLETDTPLNKKPNIIFIMADDMGYGDLGAHGNPLLKTPNLDAFVKTSLELTNFHVGTTCSPTRAGLMTGRNANRNNAWHTIGGCSILLEEEETIAEVFADNGYKTSLFGKWHLGDNYPFRPEDRGFQDVFRIGGGGVGQTPDYWTNDYFDDTYLRNGTLEKTEGYCTDVWFKEAINHIEVADESPFFMYLALNAAHGPFNVPQEYFEMYADAPLTEKQKRFYGMISNIDDNFGNLVQHLKKTNQYDNTILVFTSDNGTAAGLANVKGEKKKLGYNAGLKGKKSSHYDGGHRVPFFMSWPDGAIKQKSVTNELIAHVDMLPTLATLAGIDFTNKKPLDGQSMADILEGKERKVDRMLVVDTQRNQLPEKGRNSCVMSKEYRLIDGKELYNTLKDPGQQNDIAHEHPDIVTKMQEFYDTWWESVEPDIAYAEIPLGNTAADSVLITIHDMHTSEKQPWSQFLIREPDNQPKGFYSIKVVANGNYQFKLYRYPPESNLAMNAIAQGTESTAFKDGYPLGKSLSPIKAQIVLGKTTLTSTVDPSLPFVVLEGKLTRGSYHLESTFFDKGNNPFPSYYTEIIKL